jgi:tetratricopeptide (TPR) repeat protein
LSELGRDHEALQIFDECSRSPHGDESANYFAAEFLVKRHRYIEAEAFLERAEEQVAIRKSAYYNNCIHLLHAYCAAKLGKFDKARQLLGRMFDVDGDEEIFWVPVRPVISISTVQELIAKGLPES